jgi:hypothetical protein
MADLPPDPKAPSIGDYLTVLKMHVDMSNGEKQAIWARHATMLIGNSLIINAVRSDAAKLDAGTTLFLNGTGLALCVVWAVMTWQGWGWFRKSLADGNKVPIAPALNPLADFSGPYRRWKDSIFDCAMSVVVIFAIMYVIGLWPVIKIICSR